MQSVCASHNPSSRTMSGGSGGSTFWSSCALLRPSDDKSGRDISEKFSRNGALANRQRRWFDDNETVLQRRAVIGRTGRSLSSAVVPFDDAFAHEGFPGPRRYNVWTSRTMPAETLARSQREALFALLPSARLSPAPLASPAQSVWPAQLRRLNSFKILAREF